MDIKPEKYLSMVALDHLSTIQDTFVTLVQFFMHIELLSWTYHDVIY